MQRVDGGRHKHLVLLGWAVLSCFLYGVIPWLLKSQPDPNAEVACNALPVHSPVVASILLATLFLLFALYRQAEARTIAFSEPRFRLITHLAPAGLALATAVIVLGTLIVTGYLSGARRIPDTGAGAESAINATRELLAVFALTKGTPGTDLAPTFGALLLWASMYAVTLISAVVSLWVAAGLFVHCRAPRLRRCVSVWFALPAIGAATMLTVLAWSGYTSEFGSPVASSMLCGAWQRVVGAPAQQLAQLSDALNVVGVAVPLAVVFGACLLLEVLGREDAEEGSPIDVVKDIARATTHLDLLLYVGAAALVAGTLQVSSLYALTLAHVPTLADVKIKREICRPSSNETLPSPFSESCKNLPQQFDAAARGAELRQFAKSLTLGFGIGFSALLSAIYLGAATPLTAHARRLILPAVGNDERAAQGRLVELGIESNLVGKLGKLATTLSPLAAGLVSNLIGTST